MTAQRGRRRCRLWIASFVLAIASISCAQPPLGAGRTSDASAGSAFVENAKVSSSCVFPVNPTTLIDADGLVLKVWEFSPQPVHFRTELPDDPDLLAYRTAIRQAGADVRLPPLLVPATLTPAQSDIWRDEEHNNDQIYRGDTGSIDPITCLDALLFAEQNARLSQIDHPTEFLASVLRRGTSATDELVVVFGAGEAMFPSKSVYGLDVVDDYLAQGWRFWYQLHNHTLQSQGDRIALGVPAPSTADVRFARSLAETRGLEGVRVTNGFFTFAAVTSELSPLRAR